MALVQATSDHYQNRQWLMTVLVAVSSAVFAVCLTVGCGCHLAGFCMRLEKRKFENKTGPSPAATEQVAAESVSATSWSKARTAFRSNYLFRLGHYEI